MLLFLSLETSIAYTWDFFLVPATDCRLFRKCRWTWAVRFRQVCPQRPGMAQAIVSVEPYGRLGVSLVARQKS